MGYEQSPKVDRTQVSMDGWMDGQTDERIVNGWMGSWMDR